MDDQRIAIYPFYQRYPRFKNVIRVSNISRLTLQHGTYIFL